MNDTPRLDAVLTGHYKPRPPETQAQAKSALSSDDRSSWKCARPGCPSSSVRLTRYGYHHISTYGTPYGLDHPPVPVRPSSPRFQLSEAEEDAHQGELLANFAAPCSGCGSFGHAYTNCPDNPFIDIEIGRRMEERE